ncbi:MAG: class II aldolase/adducin family protein [Candidatus Aadella gelida]|nr:class II aldolase/adducin family protein [Candidatus Aadella gelida]
MDIRNALAAYGKEMHANKLVIASGGNISAKDNGRIFIKKKGADMSKGETGDYLEIMTADGESFDRDVFSSETPMHLACYEAREDVGAVIHAHSPFMVAVSTKTDKIENISYEADCIIGRSIPVIDYVSPGSEELGDEVAKKVKGGANAVLMKRHGALSVGRDLEEAYLRIMALERVCIAYLMGL